MNNETYNVLMELMNRMMDEMKCCVESVDDMHISSITSTEDLAKANELMKEGRIWSLAHDMVWDAMKQLTAPAETKGVELIGGCSKYYH